MIDEYQRAIDRIPDARPRLGDLPCVLGFDGTVDVICEAVQSREGPGTEYTPFPMIRDFGRHVTAADGKSAIIEIVRKQEKIGGNGPIMANALATAGLPVNYIGSLGTPNLHAAYEDFSRRVSVHSIAEPAVTHALEFENGKLMLASISTYEEIHPRRIRETLGADLVRKQFSDSRLCGLLNWACLPGMVGILDWILGDILPGLPAPGSGRERIFFFDLADPSLRKAGDLPQVLTRISRFAEHGQSVLGMNFKEAQRVADALGIAAPAPDPGSLLTALEAIRETLQIQIAMAHPVDFAACATGDGAWPVAGPYTPKPRITTGAGDHLNAGFCLALLLDFPLPEALALGVLFSGFYVREGRPPRLEELPAFVERLQHQSESIPKKP